VRLIVFELLKADQDGKLSDFEGGTEMKTDFLSVLRGRRRLRRWSLFVAGSVLVWLVLSIAVGYGLTRRLGTRVAESVPTVNWGHVEEQRLKTSDGHEIGAWFVEGRPEADGVLILHGHKGRRWNSLGRAKFFHSMGYSVLMITLRAHGDSTGDYDDVGYGARNDVLAAVGFLEKRRPSRAVLVDGVSMGAAAAVFAAGELGNRIDGYILESPYRDLKVAVWNRTDNALPPLLSHAAYLGLRLAGLLFLPHLEKISPLEATALIPNDVPVLILSGDADRAARPDEARALYERVKGHGRLVMVPNAGHGDLHEAAPALYKREVMKFCSKVSGVQPETPTAE
jgi:uncharacterized protein